MRHVSIAGTALRFDPPEAGRYDARILVLPGLFQSLACWRPLTSMLAHRGWEVYLLAREPEQELDYRGAVALACEAAAKLGEKLIVFGSDVGAAMSVALSREQRPMALALFSPALPVHAHERFQGSLGMLGRRRLKGDTGPVAIPDKLSKGCGNAAYRSEEPRAFFDSLASSEAAALGDGCPPTIAFLPGEDLLVDAEHARAFARAEYARTSPTRLAGRWWSSIQGPNVADEVHRFLILTLSDRVVDFPDEIIGE